MTNFTFWHLYAAGVMTNQVLPRIWFSVRTPSDPIGSNICLFKSYS